MTAVPPRQRCSRDDLPARCRVAEQAAVTPSAGMRQGVHAAVVAEGMAVKATVREREPRTASVTTEMAPSEMAAKVTAAMTPTMMTSAAMTATMTSAAASAERYARD
jgi:hypothetical protein